MHRLSWLPVILAGCAVGLWAGCDVLKGLNTSPKEPAAAFYSQITTFEGLEGELVFGQPVVQRGVFQPIHVAIPVRAAYDQPQRIEYRFEYFDSTGRPLRPSMDWRYILIPVRGQRVMEGSAVDTAAVDWRLELRRAG